MCLPSNNQQPMTHKPNPYAQALGKMAKGVPKRFSAAELKRRTERLREAAKLRWPKPKAPKE